jgi:hypothetical protein
MVKISTARVLSLDITGRGIAFAYFDGPERLLDFGVTKTRDGSKHAYVECAESLFWRFLPDVLVLEKARRGLGSRRGLRARTVIERIELLALTKTLPVRKVSRAEVNAAFAGIGKNKHEIALAIARFFPELEDRLPRERKPWMSEDLRANVFDAVSFAFTVYRTPEDFEEIAA